jgi:hypothetical protein
MMRPPHLSKAQAMVEHRLGAAEVANIFHIRPRGVVDNESPAKLPPLPAGAMSQQPVQSGWKGLSVPDADRYTLIFDAISRGQVANERTFNAWF